MLFQVGPVQLLEPRSGWADTSPADTAATSPAPDDSAFRASLTPTPSPRPDDPNVAATSQPLKFRQRGGVDNPFPGCGSLLVIGGRFSSTSFLADSRGGL